MADMKRSSSMTPMMRQYFEIKQQFPDALVFYRLGDFFELFYDDAKVISSLLDLTLTRRNSGSDSPIPMAGVPYQSAEGHIAKLIKLGRSVVLCDQVGEKNAKGMMERKVTRIITPGTVTDENMLSDKEDNIIASVYEEQGVIGLATLNISSGKFTASEFNSFASTSVALSKLNPAELLYPERFKFYQGIQSILCRKSLPLWSFNYDNSYVSLCKQFQTRSLNGFGIEKLHSGVCAAGALLGYVKNTQGAPIEHVRAIILEDSSAFVIIDKTARRNLELTETLTGEQNASLFDIIDHTSTPMGSRLLRSMLLNPLRNNAEVERRLDLVEALGHTSHSVELTSILEAMGDLERIVARIGLRKAQPRDLCTLRESIRLLPQLKSLLRAGTSTQRAPLSINSARSSSSEHNCPASLKTTKTAESTSNVIASDSAAASTGIPASQHLSTAIEGEASSSINTQLSAPSAISSRVAASANRPYVAAASPSDTGIAKHVVAAASPSDTGIAKHVVAAASPSDAGIAEHVVAAASPSDTGIAEHVVTAAPSNTSIAKHVVAASPSDAGIDEHMGAATHSKSIATSSAVVAVEHANALNNPKGSGSEAVAVGVPRLDALTSSINTMNLGSSNCLSLDTTHKLTMANAAIDGYSSASIQSMDYSSYSWPIGHVGEFIGTFASTNSVSQAHTESNADDNTESSLEQSKSAKSLGEYVTASDSKATASIGTNNYKSVAASVAQHYDDQHYDAEYTDASPHRGSKFISELEPAHMHPAFEETNMSCDSSSSVKSPNGADKEPNINANAHSTDELCHIDDDLASTYEPHKVKSNTKVANRNAPRVSAEISVPLNLKRSSLVANCNAPKASTEISVPMENMEARQNANSHSSTSTSSIGKSRINNDSSRSKTRIKPSKKRVSTSTRSMVTDTYSSSSSDSSTEPPTVSKLSSSEAASAMTATTSSLPNADMASSFVSADEIVQSPSAVVVELKKSAPAASITVNKRDAIAVSTAAERTDDVAVSTVAIHKDAVAASTVVVNKDAVAMSTAAERTDASGDVSVQQTATAAAIAAPHGDAADVSTADRPREAVAMSRAAQHTEASGDVETKQTAASVAHAVAQQTATAVALPAAHGDDADVSTAALPREAVAISTAAQLSADSGNAGTQSAIHSMAITADNGDAIAASIAAEHKDAIGVSTAVVHKGDADVSTVAVSKEAVAMSTGAPHTEASGDVEAQQTAASVAPAAAQQAATAADIEAAHDDAAVFTAAVPNEAIAMSSAPQLTEANRTQSTVQSRTITACQGDTVNHLSGMNSSDRESQEVFVGNIAKDLDSEFGAGADMDAYGDNSDELDASAEIEAIAQAAEKLVEAEDELAETAEEDALSREQSLHTVFISGDAVSNERAVLADTALAQTAKTSQNTYAAEGELGTPVDFATLDNANATAGTGSSSDACSSAGDGTVSSSDACSGAGDGTGSSSDACFGAGEGSGSRSDACSGADQSSGSSSIACFGAGEGSGSRSDACSDAGEGSGSGSSLGACLGTSEGNSSEHGGAPTVRVLGESGYSMSCSSSPSAGAGSGNEYDSWTHESKPCDAERTLKFDEVLKQKAELLPDLDDVLSLLLKSIDEQPSLILRDGGVIADGYNSELDELRDLQSGSESTLLKIETREKMRTGISSLKVRFNSVQGYYIEVSKAHSAKVPADYVRRQTLKHTERYITQELKDLEDKTLSAKTRALQLEKQIYDQLIDELIKYLPDLSSFAHNVARLDSSFALAKTAKAHNYVRPQLTDASVIKIDNGRHPVVEAISDKPFVANSIELSHGHNLAVISGPNMGGKSTFMRQVALISIMARMGSFVPAQSAVIGDIDRIFTRIGASDDLASGRSTFMVEMEETATILNNATEHSLVIMDEVGRGTSGAEGAAIAEAIVQYLANSIHPKTLFATHYTEVTTLVEIYQNAFNLCFNALKQDDNIVFLYQAQEGRQERSFGIEVAKLAGIPENITLNAIGFYIARSKDLLSQASCNTSEAAKQINEDSEELTLDREDKSDAADECALTDGVARDNSECHSAGLCDLDDAVAKYSKGMYESESELRDKLIQTQAHLLESKARRETLEIELNKAKQLMSYIKSIELEKLSPVDAVTLLGSLRERAFALNS